ncbi:hypothetical protein GA0115255_118254 [Streptomyces sp. Ncost-T6T-2b]|nr:hypothetical protein GA0115255_118254 [Streptomyces sp. Ncost-T6T-2b]
MGTALAAAAALTSMAACSGSDSAGGSGKGKADAVAKASPVAALKQVQQKTGGAQSAKVEGTTEMGSTMSMKQSGVVGWADGLSGAITVTYTGGTMGEALKKAGGDGSVQARYFKDEYYANAGAGMAANTGGKNWIRYSYKDLAELGGASGDVMKDQIQNSTPEEGVKALLASGDVKKVGQEDVRGVSATHYSGTVDVAELTAKNSSLDAEQLAAFKEQLALAGVTDPDRRHLGRRERPAGEEDRARRDEDRHGQLDALLQRLRHRGPLGEAGGLGHRGLQGAAEAGRYPGRGLLTPFPRDEQGRICPSPVRSRTLTRKPKTAGRRCVSKEDGDRRFR